MYVSRRSFLTAVTAGAALGLSACGSDSGAGGASASPASQGEIDKAMGTPTTLTYWTWATLDAAAIQAFQDKYPNIKVDVVNAGVATPAYQKLRTALKGGSGAPDVMFMEGLALASFAQTNDLLDLATAAKDLESSFVPSAWQTVVSGDRLLGLPRGGQPIGNLYRVDLFDKAGITAAPATWADFAQNAAAIKQQTGAYIVNHAPNDPNMLMADFQQAGAKPFSWQPGSDEVTLAVNDDSMKKVAAYWGELIAADLVSTDAAWTDGWLNGFNTGKYATIQTPIWGATVIGSASQTSGKWRLAELPQWTAGEHKSALWAGGSAVTVLSSSKNPLVATEFVKFMSADPSAAAAEVKGGEFPVLVSTLQDQTWLDEPNDFFGGQKANALYAEILKANDTSWQYVPFMEYVYSAYTETVGKAMVAKSDLAASLDDWQDQLVKYAKAQGFTVA